MLQIWFVVVRLTPNAITYSTITVHVPSPYKNKPPLAHTTTCVISVGEDWDGWLRMTRPLDRMVLAHLGLDRDAEIVSVVVKVELGWRNGYRSRVAKEETSKN